MATYSIYGQAGTILVTIASALRVDHGSGRPDLSDTNAVVIGRFDKPPQLPFVAIDLVSIDDAPDAAPMGAVEHAATCFVEGWIRSVTTSTTISTLSGVELAHSCATIIHSGFYDSAGSLKSLGCRMINIGRHEFANTEINGKKVGHWRAELTFTYKTDTTTNRGI